MPFRSKWRDCQAWRDDGFYWSTTSNEAVKLYDAALTQMIAYYDDATLGGVDKTLEKMAQADPNFVMGQVVPIALGLGTSATPSIYLHPKQKKRVDDVLALAKSQQLNPLETMHVDALTQLADGKPDEACYTYESILLEYPEDIAAMLTVLFSYFFTGDQEAFRNCLAKTVPRCRPGNPFYGYLYGLWGFSCTETNLYEQGEKLASKALGMNEHDCWATHSMAHVFYHTCRQREGAKFLYDTMPNWEVGSHLACHNSWHLALFHIENGDNDAAVSLYDTKVGINKASRFNMVDRASLLRRLELQGVNVGDRWGEVYDIMHEHLDDHSTVFGEFHALLSCLGSKHLEDAKKFISKTPEIIKTLPSHNHYGRLSESIGLPIYKALMAYEEEDFATCVNLLQPIKHKLVKVGGSNAQRDILELVLIDAALRSPDPKHSQLPRALLYERKAMRGVTPLIELLMDRASMKHDGALDLPGQ